MKTSNKTELLQKIKALADRGIDGEQENAQVILTRLMKQYGISETELENEHREMTWFKYSEETERRLLNQIIYMVTGSGGYGCKGIHTGYKQKKLGADCTAAERLEIETNYSFFKIAMKKELETFYSAFANKNQLFPPDEKCPPETEEDRAKSLKARMMMEGMEKHTLHKALTNRTTPNE